MDRVPRTVWALGLVSLFMDLSSEIIHALLPLFLTTTLGVSVVMVGLIDGTTRDGSRWSAMQPASCSQIRISCSACATNSTPPSEVSRQL